jgi:hypothetical protein
LRLKWDIKILVALQQWFSNCVPTEIQRVPQKFLGDRKYSRLSIEIWLIFQLKAAQCYL